MGRADETSAARIARARIKKNPPEVMTATVSAIDSLEMKRLNQRAGE
jgi:hypothetical protein